MTTFVLVPGMWLGAWAWRPVTEALRAAGHDVYPLTLTGLADRAHLGSKDTDLDTHTTDIVALIEAEELTGVVLVGHSYGGMPVTAAAGRVPERLARVVYVDSGPLPDGTAQVDIGGPVEPDGWGVPPREWESDDPLLAGLTPAHREALRRRATPHPYGSVVQPMRGTDRAATVPRTLIACTFPLDQVRAMMADGHPFFAGLRDADLIGRPGGHWPMFSQPVELAEGLTRAGS